MTTSHPPIRFGVPFTIGPYVTTGEFLGKGATANVYLGRNTETGQIVAIKELNYTRLSAGNRKQSALMDSEIEIMKKISESKHPNIVCLLESKDVEYPQGQIYKYLVLEYCNAKDLDEYLRKNGVIPEAQAAILISQFAAGLRFLQYHNISHRDLKPQNIMLHSEGDKFVIKIADFGFARSLSQSQLSETFCGTPLYMAPEVHNKQAYSNKADLWSVGVILYQMVCGTVPFRATTLPQLIIALRTKSITFPPHVKLSNNVKDLIVQLLQRESSVRMSWERFFTNEHGWFPHSIELPEEFKVGPPNPELDEGIQAALIIAELADIKSEENHRDEAITLYISFLNRLKVLSSQIKHPSDAEKIKVQYKKYMRQARCAASEPGAQPSSKSSEEIIYNYALALCRSSVEFEKINEPEMAKTDLYNAITYFETILSLAIYESDKEMLRELLHRCNRKANLLNGSTCS